MDEEAARTTLLDPTQKIKRKTKRIIVGHVLIPRLKNLKERHGNGMTFISKLDLFTADTRNQLAHLNQETGTTLAMSGDNYSFADRQDTVQIELDRTGRIENTEAVDHLWREVIQLVKEARIDDDAQAFFSGATEVVKGDPANPDEQEVFINGLVYLCSAVSPSPVVTTKQKRELFNIISIFAKGRATKCIGRTKFIKLVKNYLKENDDSHLKGLDLAEYALYLFPEGSGTIEADALVDLVNASSSPSDHHSFAASYVRIKASERVDFIDFLIYIPFVILYLNIVFQGKGLNPRSYHAHNLNSAFNQVLYDAEFPQGCTRSPVSGSIHSSCPGDGEITFTDVMSAGDWYDFAHGPLLNGLWGDAGSNEQASSRQIQGNIKLIGALKVRQIRQTGSNEDDWAKYFDFEGAPAGVLQAKGRAGRRYLPHDGDEILDTAVYPHVNYSNLVSPVVSSAGTDMNGFHYTNCKEGNATQGIYGDVHRYKCDGHTLIIPFNNTRDEAAAMLHQLEANTWIDVQTTVVIVDFFAHHPASGFMIGQRMLTEFHPAGAASSLFHNRPFAFYTDSTNADSAEAAWLIFVIYLILLILRLLGRSVFSVCSCAGTGVKGAAARSAALRQMSGTGWVVFDYINYTLFVIHLGYRLRWLTSDALVNNPVWQVEFFPAGYEYVAWDFNVLTHIDAVNVVLIVLSVLRYTKYVPGLDLVINTLQKSAVDCVSVFIVSFGTFLSFVVTGYAVWGDTLEDYRTFSASFMTVSVINELSYRQLHDEHPSFTYFFFVMYHFVMVACLLNMLIAVFSEAYNDVKDATFNSEEATAIFDNNPRRALTQTSRSTWRGFHFLQLIAGFCTRGDEYNYTEYYSTLMVELRVLLVPFELLVMNGEIREDRDVEDSKECLTYRVAAASKIINMLDEWIPESKIPTVATAEVQSRNIYEYCHELFEDFDYNLIFALFVLVPQNKFDIAGRKLLLDACNSFTKWEHAVLLMTHESTDSDKLQVKLETTLLHELDNGNDEDDDDVADHGDEAAAECLGGVDALAGLGTHARLVVYGVCSVAGKADLMEGNELDEEMFLRLYAKSTIEQELQMSGQELWDMLSLPKDRDYDLTAIHAQMQEFFAVRTYSFLWTPHEIQLLEEWMLGVAQGKLLPDKNKHGSLGILGQAQLALSGTFGSNPLAASAREEGGQAEEGTEDKKDGKGTGAEDDEDEYSMQPKTSQISESVSIEETEIPFQVIDGDLLVDRDTFEDAWLFAKRSRVPTSTLPRVFSTSRTGLVSMIKFLRYCNANPWAHFRQNFGFFYATSQAEASKYYVLLMNYIPFVVLIVFFMFQGSQLGESIHVTRGLHSNFDVREAGITDFAGVETYVKDTVIPGIWSGAGTESAQILNDFNFFIGAMRIRQRRVHSRDWDNSGNEMGTKCMQSWVNFFGPMENFPNGSQAASLTYPDYMDDVTKAFYDQRVAQDFYGLQRRDCFAAYDLGTDLATTAYGPATEDPATANATYLAELDPAVQTAFTYRNDGQYGDPDTIEAHDAIYPGGGHMLVLPFNLTKDEVNFKVNQMFANNWLDNQTRVVVVEWYNFNYNLRLYAKARYGVEITAGGGYWPTYELGVSSAVALDTPRLIALTVFFWLLFLGFIVQWLTNVISTIREVRRYLGYTFLGALWHSFAHSAVNTVDLTIVAFTIASWILRWINAAALDIQTIRNRDEFPVDIGTAIGAVQNIRKLDCLLIMLCFQRTFYFIRFVRRLQIIFVTFRKAIVDLLSILFLFGVAIIAFTISGVVLYGYQLQQFFNVQNAFLSLFLHVMGENDFEDMMPARPETTPLFSHMMSIICNFVLFNMVVGVLTDTYGAVKNSMWDSTSAHAVLEKHRLDDRKQKSFGTKMRYFLTENVLVMELRYFKDYIAHCGNPPVELQMRNRRRMWDLLSQWQRAIDTGLPCEATVGAARMMHIALLSKPRDDHLVAREGVENPDSSFSVGAANPMNWTGGLRPGATINNNFTPYWFGRRRRRRLRTYGVGRLPLWEEFLHDRVGPEIKHTLQWYYIQPPNHFIESVSMPDLWMEALENYYYYSQTRELYTGTSGDSSEAALQGIRDSLEAAAKQKASPMKASHNHNEHNYSGELGGFGVSEAIITPTGSKHDLKGKKKKSKKDHRQDSDEAQLPGKRKLSLPDDENPLMLLSTEEKTEEVKEEVKVEVKEEGKEETKQEVNEGHGKQEETGQDKKSATPEPANEANKEE